MLECLAQLRKLADGTQAGKTYIKNQRIERLSIRYERPYFFQAPCLFDHCLRYQAFQ
ncbi:hypothetical protein AK973_2816 [Pseudomonas brassicacearum]|nr:hypothetical protein AK973_2816 [Pseudomonas brassicacearum]